MDEVARTWLEPPWQGSHFSSSRQQSRSPL